MTDTRVGNPTTWLLPSDADAGFKFVLHQHWRQDRDQLQQYALVKHGPWAALDQATRAAPKVQASLLGCAGIHFLGQARGASLAALEQAVSGNVAEACSQAGVAAEWTVAAQAGSFLTFPNSNVVVSFEHSGVVALRTTTDGDVSITFADALTLLDREPHGTGLRLTGTPGEGVQAARLPALPWPGVQLARHGLPALLSPPAGFEYHTSNPTDDELGLLVRSLGILAHHRPRLFHEMQVFGTWLVLLERGGYRLSFTASQLPGVLYVNLVDPLETLDLVVHEFHHAKLDLLESHVPLLERPDLPVAAPWRPDIRTARGVLHGAYVFFNVADAFEPIFAEGRPSLQGRRRRVVWREATRVACQELLDSDCGLTAFGQELVRGMLTETQAWVSDAAGQYPDEVDWARLNVRRHLREVQAGMLPEPIYITGVESAPPMEVRS